MTRPLLEQLATIEGVPGRTRDKLGGKCDVLAIDAAGRILAVEVRPKNVHTIMWAAAQATVYADMFTRWLRADDLPTPATVVLTGMAQQGAELGLAQPLTAALAAVPDVVPVVAVQRGASAQHLDRFWRVHDHLLAAGVGHAALELCEVTMAGRLHAVAR